MKSILYISYDGILEPLGQSQVLGYVEKLSDKYKFTLISFEKKEDRKNKVKMLAMKKRLADKNISWTPLAYHKTPSTLATAFDIAVGTLFTLWFVVTRKVGIIHARSYVPALMALVVKRLTKVKFLFDMRGFWADERTDGGLWDSEGNVYRTAKSLERHFLLGADHVVTLTHASEQVLKKIDYLQDCELKISVIPTCADLDRFKPMAISADAPFTFGYVGSVGTWYLFDEALKFFKVLLERKPDAVLLVVNRNEHEMINKAVKDAGIPIKKVEVIAADHFDVPALISRMHVASAIIRPCYSKIASAPTKLAEYLGCGVPCVGNTGVGDMEEILNNNGVGVTLNDFSDSDLKATADNLLALLEEPDISEKCVNTAHRLFLLDTGVANYDSIYQSLVRA